MTKKSYLLFLFLISSNFVLCQNINHTFGFSMGWENIGLSPTTTWMPYNNIQHTQGSRKEMSADLAYSLTIGFNKSRFYYNPTIGIGYGATWSMAGAMNTLELNTGFANFGVYVTKPFHHYSKEERAKKVFAAFDINPLKLAIGGNLTPSKGVFGDSQREWTDPDNQFGNQYYPFGHSYVYLKYSVHAAFRFWWMASKDLGFGVAVESDVFMVEKALVFFNSGNMPLALGYGVGIKLFVVF